jgi:hypothetical protein
LIYDPFEHRAIAKTVFVGLGERVFGLLFKVDVDFGEALAGLDESTEELEFALYLNSVILSGVGGVARESPVFVRVSPWP